MFKIKNQTSLIRYFTIVLLALFIASRAILMLHAFSHQESGQGSSIIFTADNFFAKLIFAHEKSSEKKSEHCSICSLFNAHNQTLMSSSLAFYAAFLLFVFACRHFDRNKLSYLLSSNAPRAPPVIS